MLGFHPFRMLRRAVLALLLVVVVACGILVAVGLRENVAAADVAIVPGNTVNPDGRPSPRLKARLDRAAELYRARLVPRIIVSGATGSEGFNEAVVMKRYLVGAGIPGSAIIVDSNGTTTWNTAQFAAAVMSSRGWGRAIAVTQYFHLPRMRLALERFGIAHVYSAHPTFFELRDLYSIPREVVGYVGYKVRPML